VGCEPLCTNQAVRTALLAIMPTLDDVDIAPVQRVDQSRGMVIPEPGGPSGTAGGHGHRGVLTGGVLAGSRSGASAGGRGGTTGDFSTAALRKGNQTRVILDDDEVSSDEDEPLQKRLWQLSSAGPAVRDEVVVADKEATTKRAVEEATVKRVVKEATAKRVVEEAAVKKAAEERTTEEAAVRAAAVEVAGAARALPAPSQAPPTVGAKRPTALSCSTPPAKRPYRGVWKPRFVQLSPPLFFFSYYLFV
jgi:hypothetical protein